MSECQHSKYTIVCVSNYDSKVQTVTSYMLHMLSVIIWPISHYLQSTLQPNAIIPHVVTLLRQMQYNT